jgi:hypothetical protein
MAASERISVLLTAAAKRRIAKWSRVAGISMGEFLRRAAASSQPSADDNMLDAILDQMNETTSKASAAVDRALARDYLDNPTRFRWLENSTVLTRCFYRYPPDKSPILDYFPGNTEGYRYLHMAQVLME